MEDQNIEYKESWRDEYLKWICGFANAQGGKIYIGVDDNGKVIGVKDIKSLMEDIPNKIAEFQEFCGGVLVTIPRGIDATSTTQAPTKLTPPSTPPSTHQAVKKHPPTHQANTVGKAYSCIKW